LLDKDLLQHAGQGTSHVDPLEVEPDVVAKDLHPSPHRLPQLLAVGGIDPVRRTETVRVHALDQVEHHRAVAASDLFPEFHQVFEAPGSYGVGKKGGSILHESAVLDLHEALAPVAFQEEVHPGTVPVRDLGLQAFISLETRNSVRFHSLADQPIGQQGIDPHEGGGHPDHFPGVFESPSGVVVPGKVYGPAGLRACLHAARVGTVGSDHVPVAEFHISHESLVALKERALEQPWPGNQGGGSTLYHRFYRLRVDMVLNPVLAVSLATLFPTISPPSIETKTFS